MWSTGEARVTTTSSRPRHDYIVGKYPYRKARIGTDSNPGTFTYQSLKTRPDVADLGRKWTRPVVAWH